MSLPELKQVLPEEFLKYQEMMYVQNDYAWADAKDSQTK